jgi:nucleoside 2-deoxyribosyltransferase
MLKMEPRTNLAEGTTSAKSYTVYAAGNIFTQHDLAANVYIKDAVWRHSNGKFELILPQSKELRELDRPDLAAYIRNVDLLQVLKAHLFLARFDGLELDAGTVIEFMLAKFLGKPTVIWRCDSRRLGGNSLDEPYNLMVKNWPRTVEFQFDSLMNYIGSFAEASKIQVSQETVQNTLQAELNTIKNGIDELAAKIIVGLESVLELASPYPAEYQEIVYRAARFLPGGGFEQLLSTGEVEAYIHQFRQAGTL